MSETDRVLDLATRLAREAGAIQRERYETAIEIRTKSASIDLVTEVDQACEALIIAALDSERPDDAILYTGLRRAQLEYALRRRAYDVALEQYLVQAPVLRDPGISAHTTHLAQFGAIEVSRRAYLRRYP